MVRGLHQLFLRHQEAAAEARRRRSIASYWRQQRNLERQSIGSEAAPDVDQAIKPIDQGQAQRD
jgi:hypothetical protein